MVHVAVNILIFQVINNLANFCAEFLFKPSNSPNIQRHKHLLRRFQCRRINLKVRTRRIFSDDVRFCRARATLR